MAVDESDAIRTQELVSERTRFSSTFATDQPGVYQTAFSAVPLHADNEATGRWDKVDLTLVQDGDSRLRPARPGAEVSVAAIADDDALATVGSFDGAGSVSFSLDGSRPVASTSPDGLGVHFDEVDAGVAVDLEVTPLGVKEIITLASPQSPRTFRFRLTVTGDLDPVVTAWGTVDFLSPGATDPSLRIPKGWMRDSATKGVAPEGSPDGAYSEGVRYEIDRSGVQPVLVVSLDDAWLDAPERVFPVLVDPTLSAYSPATDDTYVESFFPTTDNSPDAWLGIGTNAPWSGNHAYFHLPNLSGTLAGMTIHSASFQLWQGSGSRCDVTRDLYRVTETWQGSTTNWSNQPDVDDVISSSDVAYGGSGSGCEAPGTVSFDVTTAARHWADGSWDNHGVMLRTRDLTNATPTRFGTFGSADNWLYGPLTWVSWTDPGSTGVPYPPSTIAPAGGIDTLTPTLSAQYVDPDAEQGYVAFILYDVDTNQPAYAGVGSLVPSGGTSTLTVPSNELTWEHRYRVEAIAIDDPDGDGNPFDPLTHGSVHAETFIVPTTGPFEPSQVTPAGRVASDGPELSAVYEDRDDQDGFVRFVVKTLAGATVTTIDSNIVASGERVTASIPDGTLEYDTEYEIEAESHDDNAIVSVSKTITRIEIIEPRPAVTNYDFADPEVIRDGNTYYAFSTNRGLLVPRISSSDLESWSALEEALPAQGAWARAQEDDGQFWAPAVSEFGGDWILYYSADSTSEETKCIGGAGPEATLANPFDTPEDTPLVCGDVLPGPWTDGGSIDPEVFIEDDGTPYLLWKNEGNAPGGSGSVSLWAKELDGTGLAFADGSDPVELLEYDPTTWENGALDLIEQPEMIKRGGVYHLFYSGNTYSNPDYAEGYATCPDGPRAACDKVTDGPENPWFAGESSSHDEPIVETPNGHGVGAVTFFDDGTGFYGPGVTYMAYHSFPTLAGATAPDNQEPPHPDRYRGLRIERIDFEVLPEPKPVPDPFHPPGYRGMVDIGDLGYGAEGISINDNLDIAGKVGSGPSPAVYHAGLWRIGEGWDDIGGVSSSGSVADSINDRRDMAGRRYDTIDDPAYADALKWDRLAPNGQALSTLAMGARSGAYAINENGWMVGMSEDATGRFRPALWHPSGYIQQLFGDNEIEDGSAEGEANGINDHGTTTGYYCVGACLQRKGFVRDRWGVIDIVPGLGGIDTIATDLNNDGVVTGWSQLTGGAFHAFTWDGTTHTDIFAGTTVGNSYAMAINTHGQVVGGYFTGTGTTGTLRAFFYDPNLPPGDQLWDIGDLSPTSTTPTIALDINDHGVITGSSITSTGGQHAFLRPTGRT